MTASWKEVGFGELASVTRGASPRPIASERWFDSESDVRWVRISDVNRSDGRTLRDTTQALSPDGIARSRYLKPGTLIMSIAATVGVPVISGVPACIHDGFVAIQNLKADQRFLLYLLKAHESKLREAGQSGSQMNINSDIVRDLKVRIPEKRIEQEAVAAALWGADDAIDSLERLIAKKRDVKQGMMQELLLGRTRLPGFGDEWRETTLGSFSTVVGGGTPSTRVPAYWGGDIPWFTPAEITQKGSGLVLSSHRMITQEGLNNSAATVLPAGTVLVTSRASLGHCAVAGVPVATNQGFTSLVPIDMRSTWFLYYWMQQNGSELESRAAGSTFLEISASKVSKIPFSAPPVVEQYSIGRALRDADSEISTLEQRLESARAIKIGMMQELLTGRTRLPVKEDA